MTKKRQVTGRRADDSPVLLIGGRLSVSFANVAGQPGKVATQALTWEELVGFLEVAQIITADRAKQLLTLTQNEPQAAEALLTRAESLGAALRRIFGAMVRRERVEAEWVRPLNAILQVTEGHDELVEAGDKWKMEFIAREGGLEWLLAAIARSGAEVLAEGTDARIRKCANPACELFFYDESRTHKRRWCSMALCGNRSKVAAFAKRHPT
ncbi:MAG TPA: CGNR zinc finger domain-containing protein [Candidatus Acidoferrum sp.]|nr:CGNR zinc finger domain-containing protein [Candidatus Acidoferrum sp.]